MAARLTSDTCSRDELLDQRRVRFERLKKPRRRTRGDVEPLLPGPHGRGLHVQERRELGLAHVHRAFAEALDVLRAPDRRRRRKLPTAPGKALLAALMRQ